MRRCACRVVLIGYTYGRGDPFDGSAAQSNKGNSASGPRCHFRPVKALTSRTRFRGTSERMALMGRKQKKESVGSASDAADLERLRRDLDAAETERADAVRARTDLAERRDAVLASEDVAALEAHETALAAVGRRIAVADTRCTRLAGEVEAAEAQAEQARRRAAYAQAEKALAEGRRVLEREYLPAAKALADILSRARELRKVVIEANKLLPDGADPLSTMLEAEFDGQYYPDVRGLTKTEIYFVNRKTGLRAGPTDCPEYGPNAANLWERRERSIELPLPLHPAVEHRSVIEFTNLPGITGGESYVWPASHWGRPRAGRTIEAGSAYNV